ncbi:MAG TPA: hypothetical protein VLD64_02315 [Nitrosarchaeum sp.]|nr:hypothetical protein [Nitrosarchaeum sp.]
MPKLRIWDIRHGRNLNRIIVIGDNQIHFKMEKIDYEGIVWAINHNNPEPLVEHALHTLEMHGVKKEDIQLTDAPDNVKVGAIVVEIWPYHLDVARVRTIRNESFISGTVMTIELKLDGEGNYTD